VLSEHEKTIHLGVLSKEQKTVDFGDVGDVGILGRETESG
jgi:hypothetical protein